jgi:hypothetical protein
LLQANLHFATLPAQEQAAIEAVAHGKTPRGSAKGSLAQVVIDIERARLTAERHPDHIPSFEMWKKKRFSN